MDSPIAIQWLERQAAEQGNGKKPRPVRRKREERIAIIGAGPAGLTAASDLVKKGYGATVFEASSMPGGIPATMTPNFILPQEAIQADIDYLKALGVRIHTNVYVGKDLGISGLQRQGFKAILIACGAERGAGLGIPGSDLPGVFPALSLLKESKLGQGPSLKGKVWVIGGDSVAIAAARTALRLGAEEVHIACLEAIGDRTDPANIAAPAWELEAAEREGVQIEPSLAPQEFTSEDGSKVSGIKFKRLIPLPPGGRGKVHRTLRGFPLMEMEGPKGDYVVDADTVVDAANVFLPKRRIPDMSDILGESAGKGRRGGLQVNNDTFETNVPGIFAVGDRSGTGSHIVESMADGRTAATSIDQYLSGRYVIPVKESRIELTIKPEQVPAYLTRKERWDMPRLLPTEAIKTFEGEELGYSRWQAVQEAKRCLNCRMCANCIFERGHLCKETGRRLLL
jgi:NADPH-dependent glutamate synthase beta subunit-like oxidoreductase